MIFLAELLQSYYFVLIINLVNKFDIMAMVMPTLRSNNDCTNSVQEIITPSFFRSLHYVIFTNTRNHALCVRSEIVPFGSLNGRTY